jgi:hypothetical protein
VLLARGGGGAEPQRLGQGAREHFPERVVVVVRRPLDETERAPIEERLAIEDLEDRLQACRWHGRAGGDCHHHANQALPAERHPHPRAVGRLRRGGRRRRGQVVEQLPQRGVERHPENRGHVWQGVR